MTLSDGRLKRGRQYDLGVVELDEAVFRMCGAALCHGELAPLGTAELRSGETGRDRNDALVAVPGRGQLKIMRRSLVMSTTLHAPTAECLLTGIRGSGSCWRPFDSDLAEVEPGWEPPRSRVIGRRELGAPSLTAVQLVTGQAAMHPR